MQQVLNAAGARRAKFSTAAAAPELAVSKRKKASVEKEPTYIICGFVFERNMLQDPLEKVTPDPKRDKSCAVAMDASPTPKNLMSSLDAAEGEYLYSWKKHKVVLVTGHVQVIPLCQ